MKLIPLYYTDYHDEVFQSGVAVDRGLFSSTLAGNSNFILNQLHRRVWANGRVIDNRGIVSFALSAATEALVRRLPIIYFNEFAGGTPETPKIQLGVMISAVATATVRDTDPPEIQFNTQLHNSAGTVVSGYSGTYSAAIAMNTQYTILGIPMITLKPLQITPSAITDGGLYQVAVYVKSNIACDLQVPFLCVRELGFLSEQL